MSFSIGIIGGGPAGLASAIAVKRQMPDASVFVLEKSNYDQFRPGETVPNRFGRLLYQMGLWHSFQQEEHWPAHGKRILWAGVNQNENSIFEPDGIGWHVSRPSFDRWLIREAESLGVEVLQKVSGIALERTNQYWHIAYHVENKQREVKTDFLINASGSPNFFSKQQEINTIKLDHLVATYFTGSRVRDQTYTTIAAAPNGWWYHCNVREQSVFAFFTDPPYLRSAVLKMRTDFLEELPEDKELRRSFEAVDNDLGPNWFNIVPHISTASGENWLSVGDAALRYDPLSGQGIYKAFETAIWASYAISDYSKGDIDALKKYDRVLNSMAKSYTTGQEQFYGQVDHYSTGFWERRSVLVK